MGDDLLNEFINESREHLLTIETDLLAIEDNGANVDKELVNKVFRAAHSIKGGSSFFGLTKVKELAHKAETVLDMIRSGRMTPNAEITNLLLASFDKLRDMINDPDESRTIDIEDSVASLTDLVSSYLPSEQKKSLTSRMIFNPRGGGSAVTVEMVDFDRVKQARQFIYLINYDLIHDVDQQGKNVLQVFRDILATGEILDCFLDFEAVGDLGAPISNRLPLRLVFATVMDPDIITGLFTIDTSNIVELYDPRTGNDSSKPPVVQQSVRSPAPVPEPVAPAAEPDIPSAKPPEPGPSVGEPSSAAAAASSTRTALEETLRVNVGLLEMLMNLAGELVLGRNQLHAAITQKNEQSLTMADQRINQVTSELQNAIMQTRLQPIGNVFSKFPRVVRDLSKALGKEIVLDIQGKDVALDRTLIEGLSDPLVHLVRNAVDHGIETPAERARSGKKNEGTVRIEARHEAGQVVVEIADDGKGIDPKRVADAAVRRGLIPAEKMRGMSDQDKIALIFLPGLSTSEKVSDISGRGVGMDVVKTNLDHLGGKIEIKSDVGKGSLFRIKLPLTLAIIPSLIVSVEDDQFAIPQINIEELIHIGAEDVKRRIEVVGDAEVLLLREKVIPLVRFDWILGLTPTYIDPATGSREVDRRKNIADRRSPRHQLTGDQPGNDGISNDKANVRASDGRRRNERSGLEIAVVTTGTLQYGLVVGAFHNNEEIVVKPLGRHLKGLREYAGATILGNGTIALILDIAGLAAKAELASVSGSKRASDQALQAERERLEDQQSFLIFHNAPDEICALPLECVLRLERIVPAQIETKGGRRTMQYRGSSLPLVTLSDVANVKSIDNAAEPAVIVSSIYGREVGLLGAMPLDVVETKLAIDQKTHRQKGISGSAIIGGQTTLIADLFELVDAAYPEWREESSAPKAPEGGKRKGTVLLAEDSDFFRQQVRKIIEDGGYTVLESVDGESAWETLLEHLGEVGAVVTDIEMPRLNGLELATRIRGDARTSGLPILALTSLASEEDVEKGKAAGVTDYQVKLDRDRLLGSVRGILD